MLLTTSICIGGIHAKRITKSEAWQRVNNLPSIPSVLKLKHKATPNFINSSEDISEDETEPIYIFNNEANQGFIIASGDDAYPPILGYSEHGNVKPDNIPPAMQKLLDNYRKALTMNHELAAVKIAEATDIAPMLTTAWGQNTPYNDRCPGLTGCVATAMAQIVNYHRWPAGPTTKIDAYKTETLGLLVPELPEKQFDWDNMTDDEIAWLMRYCGQSVHMNYGVSESSAFSSDVPTALINHFGYSRTSKRVTRGSLDDYEWESLIYNELKNGRPVYYDALSMTVGGHAYVVDGYSDGLFHINWGWDGSCDGYFSLQNMLPNEEMGYFNTQGAIIGIQKAAASADEASIPAYVTGISIDSTTLERESMDSDFPPFGVTFTVISDLTNDTSMDIGVAITGDNEESVQILHSSSVEMPARQSVNFDAGITFGKSLSQGKYKIYPVVRIPGSEKWVKCGDADIYYLKFNINDFVANITAMSPDNANDMDFGLHNINGITYHICRKDNQSRAYVALRNGTSKYSGDVYIPASIEFESNTYPVIGEENGAFSDAPELISLSAPFIPELCNNDMLEKLEIRGDGATSSAIAEIFRCNALTRIRYPENIWQVSLPAYCDNLTSLVFDNRDNLQIWAPTYGDDDAYKSLTDLFFASDTPPEYTTSGLEKPTPQSRWTIHVPAGTKEIYEHSQWNVCTIVEDQPANPVNVLWNYGIESNDSFDVIFGNGSNDVEAGIRIPASALAPYRGCKLSAIKFIEGFDRPIEYAFISKDDAGYITKEPIPTHLIAGVSWRTVRFSSPVTIGDDDLYIGVGCKSVVSITTMADASGSNRDGCAYLRTIGNDMNGLQPGVWYNYSSGYCFMITAVIEGDDYPVDVAAFDGEIIPVESGNPVTCTSNAPTKASGNDPQSSSPLRYRFKAKLANRTPQIVKEVTIAVHLDGKEQSSCKVPVFIPMNQMVDFETEFEVKADNLNGRLHTLNVFVSKVDGKEDALPDNGGVKKTDISLSKNKFPRKFVIEGKFGTWCSLSPSGMATMEYMASHYPENIIPISIYFREEMGVRVGTYREIYDGFTNELYLNRSGGQIMPEPFSLDERLNSAVATIEGTASFDETNGMTIYTNTLFGFDEDSADYRISCVLLEDEVGPYMQNNRSYGISSTDTSADDYLKWWREQDTEVSYVFNNVARHVFGGYNGIEGLLPKKIRKNVVYSSEMQFSVPDVFEDRSKIKLAILLIDNHNGEIINADVIKISGSYHPMEIPVKPTRLESQSYAMSACDKGLTSHDFYKIHTDVEVAESGDKVFITIPAWLLDGFLENTTTHERYESDDMTFVADKITIDGETCLSLQLPQLIYRLPHANFYLTECYVRDFTDALNNYQTIQHMKSEPVIFKLNEKGEYETDRNLAIFFDQLTHQQWGYDFPQIFRKAKLFPFDFRTVPEIPSDAVKEEYLLKYTDSDGQFSDRLSDVVTICHQNGHYWFDFWNSGSIYYGQLSDDKKSIEFKIPNMIRIIEDAYPIGWEILSKCKKVNAIDPDNGSPLESYYPDDSDGVIKFFIEGNKIIPESDFCYYTYYYPYNYLNPVFEKVENSGLMDNMTENEVINIEYFSIDGLPVINPSSGMFVIEKRHYKDGTSKTSKRIFR